MLRLFGRAKNNLSSDDKKRIRASYESAIADVGAEELDYIRHKIDGKLELLEGSTVEWERQLSRCSRRLFNVLVCWEEKSLSLTQQEAQYIIAALLYLIDPFDIIPDYMLGRGYLDDAYVLNLCIQKLNRANHHLWKAYLVVDVFEEAS